MSVSGRKEYGMIGRLGAYIPKLRNRHFLVIDILAFMITPLLALMLRMDGNVPYDRYGGSLVVVTAVFLLVRLVVFYRGAEARTFLIDELCWNCRDHTYPTSRVPFRERAYGPGR